MSLIVGGNTWATVSETDDYLSLKVGSSPWYDLREASSKGQPSKEAYLHTAYLSILAGYAVEEETSDSNVKKAQMELAFYFCENYARFLNDQYSSAKSLKSVTMSKWKEEYRDYSGDGFPLVVQSLLSGYSVGNIVMNVGD